MRTPGVGPSGTLGLNGAFGDSRAEGSGFRSSRRSSSRSRVLGFRVQGSGFRV